MTAFSRWAYMDKTSTTDAAQYQFMDLGYGSSSTSQAGVRSLIASIHQSDPQVRLLLYKTIYQSSSDTQGIGGCVAWNTSKPLGGIPSSWFLLGSNGQPLTNSTYSTYWLDPGNVQVQQACLKSAVSMAKSSGFNGIFWDMMSTSLHWAGLSPRNCTSLSCSSDAHWQAAMESFITNVTAGLHANGLIAIGNVSGGGVNFCCGGGPAIWDQYLLDGLDGAMEESFTSGTNHLPVDQRTWTQQLANEAWNEAHGKWLVANADVTTNQALNVYGLATLLLAAGGHSSWATDSGNPNTGEYWFPPYTTAQGLGAPLGSYTVQANGLYVRHFQNGTVIVNPTTSTIADPFYGSMAPQSGQIL